MGRPSQFAFLFRTEQGRIDRQTWHYGAGLLALPLVVLTGLWLALAPYANRSLDQRAFADPRTFASYAYLVVYAFAVLLIAVCYVNLSAKRFRDRGRPAPVGLAGLLPFVALCDGAARWLQPRVAEGHADRLGLGARRRADPGRPVARRGARRPGAAGGEGAVTAPSALAIAQALIRCASVTPADGGALECGGAVARAGGLCGSSRTFHRAGLPRRRQPLPRGSGRARLVSSSPGIRTWCRRGTPPPGASDPFGAEVADGMVWGRGAVDMKGGLAAGLAAALAHGAPARGSLAFLVTGDEEGPAVNGTPKLLGWARERGERFDACVLAEPTNPQALGDAIKIGRRGSLSGALVVHGRQGHVGYPKLADNPVHGLLRLCAALRAPLDAGAAHFDASNLEITSVDVGNAAVNVIPAEARARFNIRFNDLWTAASLEAELRARVAGAAEGARWTLAFQPSNAPAFLTEPGPFVDLVADAVEAETGRRPALSTSGGTSDARFIKDHCPVVEFGLVGETMHAVDERCAVADLERLQAVFARVIARFFA